MRDGYSNVAVILVFNEQFREVDQRPRRGRANTEQVAVALVVAVEGFNDADRQLGVNLGWWDSGTVGFAICARRPMVVEISEKGSYVRGQGIEHEHDEAAQQDIKHGWHAGVEKYKFHALLLYLQNATIVAV